MELGIAGKRVLVTGGSAGLGRATALAFAKEGCRVAVVARDGEKLNSLLVEMGGISAGHAVAVADLMVPEVPQQVVTALAQEGGPFDILVHNLGGTLGVKDPLASMDQWAAVWRFNVGIALEINNTLIPGMVERGWGRIVHVSSNAAETARGAAPYAAAKAFLNTYVKGVGRSFAPSGVVISALMPGAFEAEGGHWERVRRDNPAMLQDFLGHYQGNGRLARPEEITPFLLFLASPAASLATGSVLRVDGAGI